MDPGGNGRHSVSCQHVCVEVILGYNSNTYKPGFTPEDLQPLYPKQIPLGATGISPPLYRNPVTLKGNPIIQTLTHTPIQIPNQFDISANLSLT